MRRCRRCRERVANKPNARLASQTAGVGGEERGFIHFKSLSPRGGFEETEEKNKKEKLQWEPAGDDETNRLRERVASGEHSGEARNNFSKSTISCRMKKKKLKGKQSDRRKLSIPPFPRHRNHLVFLPLKEKKRKETHALQAARSTNHHYSRRTATHRPAPRSFPVQRW